ncbi:MULTISPECIES: hypothetical protein [unclassified Ruegeria]|uniref:hypothetical protein n=1 Tax=unclassified Ruegeria TaxID=2625375 RepID=UPI001487DCC0|nr:MULTISPECIES: hypothetical protein [unclassified Ruegeria]
MTKESPKEICDDTLGLAMEARGLAGALDNSLFCDNGGLQGMHPVTRTTIDGIAKALLRSTDGVFDRIEQIDAAIDWPNAAKDTPKLVNGKGNRSSVRSAFRA